MKMEMLFWNSKMCRPDRMNRQLNTTAFFRLQPAAKLPLRQAGKDIQLGQGCVSYLNDVGHKSLLA